MTLSPSKNGFKKEGEFMNGIHKNRMGLAVGSLLGLWHLVWSVLVGAGFAQHLINLSFRLHFIQPPFTLTAFSFGTAATLVAVTFAIGYILGWVFGAIWNRLHFMS